MFSEDMWLEIEKGIKELRSYKNAWLKLIQIFDEQQKQEELNLMESILKDMQNGNRE